MLPAAYTISSSWRFLPQRWVLAFPPTFADVRLNPPHHCHRASISRALARARSDLECTFTYKAHAQRWTLDMADKPPIHTVALSAPLSLQRAQATPRSRGEMDLNHLPRHSARATRGCYAWIMRSSRWRLHVRRSAARGRKSCERARRRAGSRRQEWARRGRWFESRRGSRGVRARSSGSSTWRRPR